MAQGPLTPEEIQLWADTFQLLIDKTISFSASWTYDIVPDPPEYTFTFGTYKYRVRSEPYGAVTTFFYMNVNRVSPATPEVDHLTFESNLVAAHDADSNMAALYGYIRQQVADPTNNDLTQLYYNTLFIP